MSQTTTFAEIKTFLDTILDDAGTTFWTLAEREQAVNNAYFQLYNHAVSLSDGMGPEVTSTTLAIASGTNTIALPAGFYRLISLFYKDSDTAIWPWIHVSRRSSFDFIRKVSRGSRQMGFTIEGSNLVIFPTPDYTEASKLNLIYIPEPTQMTLDADTPTGIPFSHRELIAYEAAKRLMEKQGVNLGKDADETRRTLQASFDRDMETRQLQDSRRVSGVTGYEIYGTRI